MSSPIKATNPISFQWMPTPYLVRWADSEKEVPEWDVTRGCPLWAHLDKVRQSQSWGPKYVPPAWEIKPAPDEGYPRLVRSSLYDFVGGGEQRTGYPLLNDLSSLQRYVKVKHLKNRVAKLSSIYGEASDKGNTLNAWLELAAVVRLHRRLKRELKKGGLDGFAAEWTLAYDALAGRKTVDQEEYVRRERRAKEAKPVNSLSQVAATPILSNLDSVEETVLRGLEFIRSQIQVQKAETSRDIRLAIANSLYDSFGMALHLNRSDSKVLLQHWGTRVYCRVGLWTIYALSEMWRHDAALKICPGCHLLFTPTQGNNIYCEPGGACAVEAHRRKHKN